MGDEEVSQSRASELSDRASRDARSDRGSDGLSMLIGGPSYSGDSLKGEEKTVYDNSYKSTYSGGKK